MDRWIDCIDKISHSISIRGALLNFMEATRRAKEIEKSIRIDRVVDNIIETYRYIGFTGQGFL